MIHIDQPSTACTSIVYLLDRGLPFETGAAPDPTVAAVERPASATAWARLAHAGHGHDGLAVTA